MKLKRSAVRDLLEDDDASATVLAAVVLASYGVTSLYDDEATGEEAWDSALLFNKLEVDFSARLSIETENRLNAIKMAMSSPHFFEEPDFCAVVSMAMATGDTPDAVDSIFSDVEPQEILWGLYEVTINLETPEPASPKVLRMLKHLLMSSGGEQFSGTASDMEGYMYEAYERMLQQFKSVGFEASYLRAIPDPLDFARQVMGSVSQI